MSWVKDNARIEKVERPMTKDRYGKPVLGAVLWGLDCRFRRVTRLAQDDFGKAVQIDAAIEYEGDDRILIGDRVTVEPVDSEFSEVYNVVSTGDVQDWKGDVIKRTAQLEKV